jgi:biopolymer transport protein ExbD
MSAQFVKIYEMSSNVPIVSNEPPPKNQKDPLALTLKIDGKGFLLLKGVPSQVIKRIGKTPEGTYNLLELHEYLINIKKQNKSEKDIIFEPQIDLTYKEIVDIMDAVRLLKKTDETLYTKDKEGLDIQIKELFNKIVFGNLMS